MDFVIGLESPIGVYLRREVFGKENVAEISLKKELYDKIVARQSTDGSWDQMFVHTANRLWDLALLGYDATDQNVKRGLKWLRSIQKHQYHGLAGFFYSDNREDPSTMRSTLYGEFGPGCSNFYQTTYAVHLFHIFGLDDDPQIQTIVKSYLQLWGDKGRYCGIWCTLNVLRILIEHPLSAESGQVENGLKRLASLQTPTGTWKEGCRTYPFYHVFNALSRAQHSLAKQQLSKALPSVVRRQNKNGSWGGKARETTTYLVLNALKTL